MLYYVYIFPVVELDYFLHDKYLSFEKKKKKYRNNICIEHFIEIMIFQITQNGIFQCFFHLTFTFFTYFFKICYWFYLAITNLYFIFYNTLIFNKLFLWDIYNVLGYLCTFFNRNFTQNISFWIITHAHILMCRFDIKNI